MDLPVARRTSSFTSCGIDSPLSFSTERISPSNARGFETVGVIHDLGVAADEVATSRKVALVLRRGKRGKTKSRRALGSFSGTRRQSSSDTPAAWLSLAAITSSNRLGDGRKSIGEVRPAAAPDLDAFALLQGGDAEAGPGGHSDWQACRAITGVGSRCSTTSVAL
jgi:hypothetical protein